MVTKRLLDSVSTDRCTFGLFYEFDKNQRESVPSVRRTCGDPRHVQISATRHGLYDYWRCGDCGATGSIDTAQGD